VVGHLDLPLKAEGDVAHDGRTDRQNYDSQDRASIAASRGKNVSEIIPIDLNMSVCVCVCVCVCLTVATTPVTANTTVAPTPSGIQLS